MSNNTAPTLITRILSNEAARKGVAAAFAGVIVATVVELWSGGTQGT